MMHDLMIWLNVQIGRVSFERQNLIGFVPITLRHTIGLKTRATFSSNQK